jgi:hypothetical protein
MVPSSGEVLLALKLSRIVVALSLVACPVVASLHEGERDYPST